MSKIQYSAPLHGADLFYAPKNSSRNSRTKDDTLQHDSKTNLALALNIREGEVQLPSSSQPIWQLKDSGQRYHTEISLHRLSADRLVLSIHCEGRGKFLIEGNSMTIDWEAGGTDASHYFQTLGMALWLELQAIPCIHANALLIDNKCIALIAPSGMGKTTLSAYLQEQGATWLTDDMLAFHKCEKGQAYYVYPSWPKARMWPDSLRQVAHKQPDEMDKVHQRFDKVTLNLPETNPRNAYKLDAIYVLNRTGANLASLQRNQRLMTHNTHDHQASYLASASSDLALVKIKSSMALMALLQNSMLGDAYSSLNIEYSRLQQLSDIVNSVPIKQLHYKNSFDSLADIHKLMLGDLRGIDD